MTTWDDAFGPEAAAQGTSAGGTSAGGTSAGGTSARGAAFDADGRPVLVVPEKPWPEGYVPTFNRGYNAYIGPVWYRAGERDADGTVRRPAHFFLDIGERHMNGAGAVHGGLLMGLADIVLGSLVSEAIGRVPCSTVSLNCDFVAAGREGDRIEGTAWVTRRTRSLVFVSGELWTERDGERRTLMSATGLWKILAGSAPGEKRADAEARP